MLKNKESFIYQLATRKFEPAERSVELAMQLNDLRNELNFKLTLGEHSPDMNGLDKEILISKLAMPTKKQSPLRVRNLNSYVVEDATEFNVDLRLAEEEILLKSMEEMTGDVVEKCLVNMNIQAWDQMTNTITQPQPLSSSLKNLIHTGFVIYFLFSLPKVV